MTRYANIGTIISLAVLFFTAALLAPSIAYGTLPQVGIQTSIDSGNAQQDLTQIGVQDAKGPNSDQDLTQIGVQDAKGPNSDQDLTQIGVHNSNGQIGVHTSSGACSHCTDNQHVATHKHLLSNANQDVAQHVATHKHLLSNANQDARH